MIRLPRPSLLAQFAITSAIPIILLGVVLGQALNMVIRERSLANARDGAELVSRLGIQPLLTPTAIAQGLAPEEIRMLDEALHSGGMVAREIARINVWNRDYVIAYSDDHGLIGRAFQPSDELKSALAGRIASELDDPKEGHSPGLARYGPLLEVYVPIRFAEGTPVGAFEIYVPYAPIAKQIQRDTLTLDLILVAGLLLVYGLLFRIVARASARLRRQAEEKEHQALHDALTGLPNRALFRERLATAVAAARRDTSEVAVILMDLDGFKEINDTLGHDNGDLMLQEIARRLREALPETELVARLGGDEFAVLKPKPPGLAVVAYAADRLLDALERPVVLNGIALHVRASMGIALFPDHGEDPDALLRRADVAMYRAKKARSGYKVYAAEHDPYVPERLQLLAQLERAIRSGELLLHYQPKVEMRSARVWGAEALVRWQHPERGLLLPDAFIPLAEHTGLIRPLTLHVLRTALAQWRAWQEVGVELNVAVNLSAQDLLDPRFPDEIGRVLTELGVPPGALQLEITESSVMADPALSQRVVGQLHDMGIRFALDDFGTGYSSLAVLRRLPVDEIKIDKSFVMGMAVEQNDAAIVRSIIDLSHHLHLEVVAEGVESASVGRQLAALGCDLAQGFDISRPVSPQDLTAWLRQWRARGGWREAA